MEVVKDFTEQLKKFTYVDSIALDKYVSETLLDNILKNFISSDREPVINFFKKNSKITIFNGLIHLNMFHTESKKTKMALLKHINLIKMAIQVPMDLPKGLGSIVESVASLIQNENINPATLLQDIFSQKKSKQLETLLESVKTKLDSEIQTGNLSEKELVDYTHNVMNKLNFKQPDLKEL
jgi:UTP-glucose-1-phosphate uridylyltransferase